MSVLMCQLVASASPLQAFILYLLPQGLNYSGNAQMLTPVSQQSQ
jgi:hypothetical protein